MFITRQFVSVDVERADVSEHSGIRAMIPLELFNGDDMAARRKNAFAKAEREKPVVAETANGPNRRFFSVNQYTVEIMSDADKQRFIECNCAAGLPPIDPATNLPAREPQPCYHAAAVLIWEAENGSSTTGS